MDRAGRTLGLLLSTAPDHPNLETAVGLVEAALDRGAVPFLYLIDEGVRAVDDPRLLGLATRGARLFVCAYGRRKRSLPLRDPDRVTYCGLGVLTQLLDGTERFVTLT